jgi:hypothetical protein
MRNKRKQLAVLQRLAFEYRRVITVFNLKERLENFDGTTGKHQLAKISETI